MIEYTILEEDAGSELFDLLEKNYPEFDDRDIAAAFAARDILLNGEEAFGDDAVNEGDLLELFVPNDVVGIDLTPSIIYQDENFVIVDKPAGLESFSDFDDDVTALTMVEDIMKQQGEYSVDALMVPYLVYPIEQHASGLLVLAKHESGYLFMTEALSQRRIARRYVCPVKGSTEAEEEMLAYHKRDKAGKRVRISDNHIKDAKPIVTRINKLAEGETMSLLNVRPVTNLLHQVRAHLAHEGLPVLGDGVYGDKRFNRNAGADQICLWLHELCFETGTGHEYAYLNGKTFDSATFSFPRSVYDEGLLGGE